MGRRELVKTFETWQPFAENNNDGSYLEMALSEEEDARPRFLIVDPYGNAVDFVFDDQDQMKRLFAQMSWLLED
jgi:hypothetical protein